MPTNTQRITAVAATAIIVLSGGWLASLVPAATATENLPAIQHSASQPATPIAPGVAKDQLASVGSASAPISNIAGKAMRVSINGIRSDRGKIYVALFDNADAFNSYDYEQAADFREVAAKRGTVTVDFTGLAEAAYAISLFHDENGNQNFDMVDGYPAEGYGTSRARSHNDELKFHQASIKPGPTSVKVYYLD